MVGLDYGEKRGGRDWFILEMRGLWRFWRIKSKYFRFGLYKMGGPAANLGVEDAKYIYVNVVVEC